MNSETALAALRMKLAEEEDHLAKKGALVRFSPSGPTSMTLMKAVIAVVEAQAQEIAELRKRLDSGDIHAGA